MSSCSSSLKHQKRIVIKNPDGSFSYLYKEGEIDSTFETKLKIEHDLKQNQENLDNLVLSDDELQFLIDHADRFDYHSLIEQVIDVFKSYRFLFIVALLLEMLLMSGLLYNAFKNKEASILMMEEIYTDLSPEEANMFFNFAFIMLLALNLVYYPLGLISISMKKIKQLKYFAILSLYTAIATVFVIYINVLFILVFILRLSLYGFAKFLIDLLISIILIPNRHHQLTNGQAPVQEYGTI